MISKALPTRADLHDIADAMRDEIEELADERNEWAWAADELAAVLTLLCRSTGHESPRNAANIWKRADVALARWAELGADEE